jgi:hypothetical protein
MLIGLCALTRPPDLSVTKEQRHHLWV